MSTYKWLHKLLVKYKFIRIAKWNSLLFVGIWFNVIELPICFQQTSLKYNVYNVKARPAFDIRATVIAIKVGDQTSLKYEISVR